MIKILGLVTQPGTKCQILQMLLNDSLLVPSAIIWIDQYLMMILMTVIIELLMMMMRGYTISLSKQVAQSVRMD